jgi:hypothetical protein
MTASLQALIRAIDALQPHEPEVEGPQGATENIPVAPDNLLEKQARGHTSHRGHSQTIDRDENQRQQVCNASDRVHARNGSPPKIYLPTVAPVAHVALGIDSKGENRGHTATSCGPLWPPPGFPRVSAPGGIPDEWLAGAARLPTIAWTRDYPAPACRQLMIDAERFLEFWGAQAASLGWQDWELFGCHQRAPWARFQGIGLVLLLRGRELAALTESEAATVQQPGAGEAVLRGGHDHSIPPRLPWKRRPEVGLWPLTVPRGHLEPGGLVFLARSRPAAKHTGVGDAPGLGGRPVRQEQAQGMLVAALGVLAAHHGYGEIRRAC